MDEICCHPTRLFQVVTGKHQISFKEGPSTLRNARFAHLIHPGIHKCLHNRIELFCGYHETAWRFTDFLRIVRFHKWPVRFFSSTAIEKANDNTELESSLMTKDKRLRDIKFADVLEKRRLGQALNMKEFAVLAGISYSAAHEWFR